MQSWLLVGLMAWLLHYLHAGVALHIKETGVLTRVAAMLSRIKGPA